MTPGKQERYGSLTDVEGIGYGPVPWEVEDLKNRRGRAEQGNPYFQKNNEEKHLKASTFPPSGSWQGRRWHRRGSKIKFGVSVGKK